MVKKRGKTATDAGEGILNISRKFGNPPSTHHGDRGAIDDSQIEGDAFPVVNEEPELPVAIPENPGVPVSRSEILELQTRLASIEPRDHSSQDYGIATVVVIPDYDNLGKVI